MLELSISILEAINVILYHLERTTVHPTILDKSHRIHFKHKKLVTEDVVYDSIYVKFKKK